MFGFRMWMTGLLSIFFLGLPVQAIAKPVKSLKSKKMAWFFNKSGVTIETVLRDIKDWPHGQAFWGVGVQILT